MRSRLLATLIAAAFLTTAVPYLSAQEPRLVYPANDPVKDIADALGAAGKDRKHVLVDFGADWCPDCRVLGALIEAPAVAPFVQANFHVVHVDVGRRDKNLDLVERYKATAGDWIPAVVVLDPSGATVGLTNDAIRLTRRTTATELLEVLRSWAPRTGVLELASFTEHRVQVRVALERGAGDRGWLAATFQPLDDDTHLYAQGLPARGIDGVGRPTRLDIVGSSGVRVTGPAVANRREQTDEIPALNLRFPVYPAGDVTLRVPVRISGGVTPRADLSLTYMGCGSKGCLPPVVDKRISVTLADEAAR